MSPAGVFKECWSDVKMNSQQEKDTRVRINLKIKSSLSLLSVKRDVEKG